MYTGFLYTMKRDSGLDLPRLAHWVTPVYLRLMLIHAGWRIQFLKQLPIKLFPE
jgi:hypothetical protein